MELLQILKSKALLIGGAVIAFLAMALKVSFIRGTRWKTKAKEAGSERDYLKELDSIEEQIDQEYSRRAEVSNEQKKAGVVPDVISTDGVNKF